MADLKPEYRGEFGHSVWKDSIAFQVGGKRLCLHIYEGSLQCAIEQPDGSVRCGPLSPEALFAFCAAPQEHPDAKDAARYRWLRDRFVAANFDWDEEGGCAIFFEWPKDLAVGADCDENIDSAIGRGAGGEDPKLICPVCKVDRFKVGCSRNPCGFVAVAGGDGAVQGDQS